MDRPEAILAKVKELWDKLEVVGETADAIDRLLEPKQRPIGVGTFGYCDNSTVFCMFAKTLEELNSMADLIGISRTELMEPDGWPHYMLNEEQQIAARYWGAFFEPDNEHPY